MKKIFVFLSALFAIVACSKEATVSETVVKELVFNISVNHPEDTKAVKAGWESGDKVYVFFEGITATNFVTLTYNGTSWGATLNGALSENALIDALSAKGNMYGVFFPYEQPVIESDGGTGVTFKTGGTNPAKAGLGIYTYYMTSSPTATYTKDTSGATATLTGTLNMANPVGYVQFYIGDDGEKYNADGKYRLSVEGVKPTACVSYDAGVFGTKELNAAQPMWGYKLGDGVAFSGVIDGTWDDVSDHIIYLFDIEDAAKAITISDKTLSSHDAVNFTSKYHPTNAETLWAAAATVPGTVEVGGISWGTFNLGATDIGTSEEFYGWYFLWGDIIPERETGMVLRSFGYPDFYEKTVAYEALAGKTVDLTGDYAIYDAAKAFLGSPWRMFTESEIAQLAYDGETPRYDWDGTVGPITFRDVIVFPAAGGWDGNVRYLEEIPYNHFNVGTHAYYWTSCFKDGSNASRTDWKYDNVKTTGGKRLRSTGASVRPVHN